MKKLFLAIFCIIIAVPLYSQHPSPSIYQNGDYYPYYEKAVFDKKERNKYQAANIKTERRINVSEKKGDILELEQIFGSDGALTSTKRRKWNRNKYNYIQYKYNSIGDISEVVNNYYNKKIFNSKYQYNDDGLKTFYSISSDKNGLIRKVETEYNGKLITQQAHYFKTAEEPRYEWTYQFHEDSSRKQTDYYKKKKLKYTWHYECDPAGKIVQEKHKDTSTICIREETDENGDLVKFMQTTSQKGNIFITKTTFDKKGKATKSEINKLSGTPISYWEHSDTINIYRHYKKGKLKYENITNYDLDGNQVKYTYNHSKKKWSSTIKYTYNDKGLLSETKRYDYKNRLKSIYRYEREFY